MVLARREDPWLLVVWVVLRQPPTEWQIRLGLN